jgi:uncharacterized damage-inducible protein DinB
MISPAHAQAMARYNRWQNRSIYGAADTLTDDQRRECRGAFLGSIQVTVNHILWGDRTWMSRLAGWEPPTVKSGRESPGYFPVWEHLKRERQASDEALIAWADGLDAAALEGDFSYFSPMANRQITKPRWLLVTHLFNHQTHHRGQVHCLLTQLGCKPEDTDLPFGPEA